MLKHEIRAQIHPGGRWIKLLEVGTAKEAEAIVAALKAHDKDRTITGTDYKAVDQSTRIMKAA